MSLAGRPRCGSAARDDVAPATANAASVQTLIDGGAVILGKTTTARVRGRHDQPAGSQSVESEPYSGRQLGGVSRGGGGGRVPGRDGLGHWWQHSHTGGGLWRHRIQARVWPARCCRSLSAVLVPRYARADRADRRRHLDHVERIVELRCAATATLIGKSATPRWHSAVVLFRFAAPGCARRRSTRRSKSCAKQE